MEDTKFEYQIILWDNSLLIVVFPVLNYSSFLAQVGIPSETNLSNISEGPMYLLCFVHIVTRLPVFHGCQYFMPEVSCALIVELENRYYKFEILLCRAVHVPF